MSWFRLSSSLVSICLLAACAADDDVGLQASDLRDVETLAPIPTSVEVDEALVALGKRLYEDPGLSGDGTIACASCHDVAAGGDDGLPTSLGIDGQLGPINAPTVLNSSFNLAQFWDGRAATLEEQALGPVANPIEMGGDWSVVEEYLAGEPSYAADFEALFAGAVTADNAVLAIAEFERTLITPNSAFDRFLRGDDGALTVAEMRGAIQFVELGCDTCHDGPALGGGSYRKMGVLNDYFADRGDVAEVDYGRFNVTGDEADRHVFKVPTLRNIELTGPYFHDGSVTTLEDAVRKMAYYQLDVELTDAEVADLVAFLRTLTGEIPE